MRIFKPKQKNPHNPPKRWPCVAEPYGEPEKIKIVMYHEAGMSEEYNNKQIALEIGRYMMTEGFVDIKRNYDQITNKFEYCASMVAFRLPWKEVDHENNGNNKRIPGND